MSTLSFSRNAPSLFLAATMLAGCGGPQPLIGAPGAMLQSSARAMQPVRSGSWMLRKATTVAPPDYKISEPLAYVTNYTDPDVTVYPARAKDPAPIAVISDQTAAPSGDCIDSHGTLYVANQPPSGRGWVSEYPLGKTSASKVITNGMNTPAFCAIDSKGNLWVTNIGGPNVTEYLYGSKKPHTVITKGMVYPVGVAIDHSGNLYVANRLGSSPVTSSFTHQVAGSQPEPSPTA
jgi:hypothetical protein